MTKIDLTESGPEMLDRLAGAGKNLKLKMGFIPVRSQGVAGVRKCMQGLPAWAA